ncbi:MAG TPA: stage II sporulation protein R [Clostridiales bacterium]|nr:MAG: stage II sporulation protein R [Clostridiales bacterium GWD2_32_19]HCC06704.1 stage II sporulation protein R [Clostridiales bacterium]
MLAILKKERNILILSLIIGMIITFSYVTATASFYTRDLQEDMASKIIRFHCIANSDSSDDQTLKLKVRDEILNKMRDKMSDAQNINETRKIILENIDSIKKVAESVVASEGKNYKVQVKLQENVSFPVKEYGDIVMPAGKYEALRVIIGSGEGKNWWCVMFPPLCFVDESYAIVDSKSNKKLKDTLTYDEYRMITENKKVDVKVKFRMFQ